MTRLHVVDTIGDHSGMQRYDAAMLEVLLTGSWPVRFVSNFDGPHTARCLHNFYRGPLWRKLALLGWSFLRFVGYRLREGRRDDWWIYQCYGMRSIDVLFLLPLLTARRRVIVLIHDVYSITSADGPWVLKAKAWIYRRLVHHVIVHSTKARDDLSAAGFSGNFVEVPLFQSRSKPDVEGQAVGEDVAALRREPGVFTALFFGSYRRTKGLDTAFAAIAALSPEQRRRVRFIVAGQDLDRLIGTPGYVIDPAWPVVMIKRFIDDAEVARLADLSDAVLLPYREIYQSGVLDVAVAHRRPIVTSSLPYFEEILARYPSFGFTFGLSATDLAAFFVEASADWPARAAHLFAERDVQAYYASNADAAFMARLRELIG